jgi:hypothetical protein
MVEYIMATLWAHLKELSMSGSGLWQAHLEQIVKEHIVIKVVSKF